MPAEIQVTERGWKIQPPAGKALNLGGLELHKIEVTITRAAMTDGGAAVGTYTLTDAIPAGALFIASIISAITGFIGNTSAAITIGDGTDVDRYNTGTPSVFTTAAKGIAAGVPSGDTYHTAQINPVVTITGGTDFTNISAGSVTIAMLYWLPVS